MCLYFVCAITFSINDRKRYDVLGYRMILFLIKMAIRISKSVRSIVPCPFTIR